MNVPKTKQQTIKSVSALTYESYLHLFTDGTLEGYVLHVMKVIGPYLGTGRLQGRGGRRIGGSYNRDSKSMYLLNVIYALRAEGHSYGEIMNMLNMHISIAKFRFNNRTIHIALEEIRSNSEFNLNTKVDKREFSRHSYKKAKVESVTILPSPDLVKEKTISQKKSTKVASKSSFTSGIDMGVLPEAIPFVRKEKEDFLDKYDDRYYPVDIRPVAKQLYCDKDMYPNFSGSKAYYIEDLIVEGVGPSTKYKTVRRLPVLYKGFTSDSTFSDLVDFIDSLPYQGSTSKSGVDLGIEFDDNFLSTTLDKVKSGDLSDLYWGRFMDAGLWQEVISRLMYAQKEGMEFNNDLLEPYSSYSIDKLGVIGLCILERISRGFGDILGMGLGFYPSWVNYDKNDFYPSFDVEVGDKLVSSYNPTKSVVGTSAVLLQSAWGKKLAERGKKLLADFFMGKVPGGKGLQTNIHRVVTHTSFNFLGPDMLILSPGDNLEPQEEWVGNNLTVDKLTRLVTLGVSSAALPTPSDFSNKDGVGFSTLSKPARVLAQCFASSMTAQINVHSDTKEDAVSSNMRIVPAPLFGKDTMSLSIEDLKAKLDYKGFTSSDMVFDQLGDNSYMRVGDLRSAMGPSRPFKNQQKVISIPSSGVYNTTLQRYSSSDDSFVVTDDNMFTNWRIDQMHRFDNLMFDYFTSVFVSDKSMPVPYGDSKINAIPLFGAVSKDNDVYQSNIKNLLPKLNGFIYSFGKLIRNKFKDVKHNFKEFSFTAKDGWLKDNFYPPALDSGYIFNS